MLNKIEWVCAVNGCFFFGQHDDWPPHPASQKDVPERRYVLTNNAPNERVKPERAKGPMRQMADKNEKEYKMGEL